MACIEQSKQRFQITNCSRQHALGEVIESLTYFTPVDQQFNSVNSHPIDNTISQSSPICSLCRIDNGLMVNYNLCKILGEHKWTRQYSQDRLLLRARLPLHLGRYDDYQLCNRTGRDNQAIPATTNIESNRVNTTKPHLQSHRLNNTSSDNQQTQKLR